MSFSSSDDDSQQRFALGFLFALIALVVSVTVGSVVVKQLKKQPAQAATAAAPTAAADASADVASVVVENGVVKFFFASAKSELAAGATEALAEVVKGVAAGKKVIVSGYHDASGDPGLNAELAKQRALAVAEALKALSIADDKIELKKPEQAAAGNSADARRVEVVLVD